MTSDIASEMASDLVSNMTFDIIIDVATVRKSRKQLIQETNNLIFCKYCQQRQIDCNLKFVNPCICSNYVCVPCLKRQIELKKCLYCEICSGEYVVTSDTSININVFEFNKDELNNDPIDTINPFSDHIFVENPSEKLIKSNISIDNYEPITKNKKKRDCYQILHDNDFAKSQVSSARTKLRNIRQKHRNEEISKCKCYCVML